MNILITGGAGFIGSHLVDFLITKKEIKKIIVLDNIEDGSLKNLKDALKNSKVKFFKRDIRNFKSIKNCFRNVDQVVHLAALSDIVPSIENPIEYLNTNIMGTVNILESMRIHKIKKIVYSASSSCYGIPFSVPTKETDKISTRYPYAYSKYIGEQTIKHWAEVYKLNYISLRLFNVYGIRSRTHGAYGAALGVFLKQKLSKTPFTVVGNGKQKRDFIYVSDIVNAFYLSINTKNSNKIFNVGCGKPESVNSLLNYIGGKKMFIPKRPGEPEITHANISSIKRELKWQPTISLKKGIEKVLEKINYWQSAPLWTPKKIEKSTKNWFKYLK